MKKQTAICAAGKFSYDLSAISHAEGVFRFLENGLSLTKGEFDFYNKNGQAV